MLGITPNAVNNDEDMEGGSMHPLYVPFLPVFVLNVGYRLKAGQLEPVDPSLPARKPIRIGHLTRSLFCLKLHDQLPWHFILYSMIKFFLEPCKHWG